MTQTLPITNRTKVKRMSARANYDQAAIYAALAQSPFTTIAFYDGTNVNAIPTAIWREENHLYIHGSTGSRLINFLQTGAQVCVSVTHMQGLVLARSAFKHSMNYTSVCIYGAFEAVDEDAKKQHMQRFMEHWMPNRWQFVRQPDKNELATVTILRIPIVEAVLKSRQGPPVDKDTDMEYPVWAGVIPLHLQWQTPQQVPEQQNQDLPGCFWRGFNSDDFSQNTLEKLNQIISLENIIKYLTDTIITVSNTYLTDLFICALVDRHLKLSKGFRCLIESKNIQCAFTILRCQIDNIARLHALELFEGREREFIDNFLNPKKKIRKLRDNYNKELHDGYLAKKLGEAYPELKIEQAYKELCGYVHLSFYHHRDSSHIKIDSKNIEISASISRDDDNLRNIDYLAATNNCLALNEVLYKELKNYFSKRHNFVNNILEVV